MIKQYYYYNFLFQKSFIEKNEKDAAIAAIFTSSLYFGIYLMFLAQIFAKFHVFGRIVGDYILNNNTWIYYLGTGALVFFFFTCFYRKKYLKIIAEMENIDENQKKFWKKFTTFFKLGTFVMFIVSMIIMHIWEHSQEIEYLTNTSTINKLSVTSSGQLLIDVPFDINTLNITKITDENDFISFEYKNNFGQVITPFIAVSLQVFQLGEAKY